MPPFVFYEYQWRGERRAIACFLYPDSTVTLYDRLTGEEIPGPWRYADGVLMGDGELSGTRREGVAAALSTIQIKGE